VLVAIGIMEELVVVEYMLVDEDKILLLVVEMVAMLESDGEASDEDGVTNKESGIVRTLGIDVVNGEELAVCEIDMSSGTEEVRGT
jgi:hypothetical protein